MTNNSNLLTRKEKCHKIDEREKILLQKKSFQRTFHKLKKCHENFTSIPAVVHEEKYAESLSITFFFSHKNKYNII